LDKDLLVKTKATVTITEAEMVVDFTGSSPVTRGPINIPFGCTLGVAGLVFKAITTPETPANEGNFRPLRVEAPPGTLMHAVPPAATFTLWPALLAPEVVTKALAQGMPDVVPACSAAHASSLLALALHPPHA